MNRVVILTIDNIVAMIHDYAGEALDLPAGIKPVKFRLASNKKLEIIVESESWARNQVGEEVRFDLKRVYSV
jgi:hypothetical protein